MPNDKLNEVNQIHGRTPEAPFGGAKNLDEICGRQIASSYSQKSEDEYKTFLDSLDSADMRNEAMRIGMVPSPDPRILKRNLLARFLEASVPFKPMTLKNANPKKLLPVDLRNRMGGE